MNVRVRKECQQIAIWVLCVTLLVVIAISVWGNEVIEVGMPGFGGNDSGRLIATLLTLLGASLGFWQFNTERAWSTESYLVHRDGGHAAAFRSKVLAAWLGGALFVVAVAVAFVVRTWLFDPNAHVARWSSLVEALWTSLLFVPAHAAGVFVSQLRLPAAGRLISALLMGGGVLVAAIVASRDLFHVGAASPWLYLAALATLTALLLAAARRMFAAGDDRDLPFTPRLAIGVALLVLASAVPLLENVIGVYQRRLLELAERRRPVILADATGPLFLARQTDTGVRRVDGGTGAAIGEPLTPSAAALVFDDAAPYTLVYGHHMTPLEWSAPAGDPTRPRGPRQPFAFAGSWQHVVMGGAGEWSAWFASRSRQIEAYRHEGDERRRVVLSRPDGREFSLRTVIVYTWVGHRGAAVVDLGDGTAWRFDAAEQPRLVAMSLPDGDRIRSVEMLQSPRRALVGIWEPFGYSDVLVVIGERGKYTHDGQTFQPWSGDAESIAPADFAAHMRYQVRRVGGDRVTPVVAVFDAHSGAELFRHEYRAGSLLERAALITTRLLGLARSPCGLLGNLLADDVHVQRASIELARHATRPIWYLHLLLVLLMVFDVRRHTAGAAAPVRLLWMAVTALCGCVGWIACRSLERRRPIVPAAADGAAVPRPILATA